jgi:hypothetical protein
VERCLDGRDGEEAEPDGDLHESAREFLEASFGARRRMLLRALQDARGNLTGAGIRLGFHARRNGDPANLNLQARKLAHRKFRYWWQRLMRVPLEAAADSARRPVKLLSPLTSGGSQGSTRETLALTPAAPRRAGAAEPATARAKA